MSRLRRTIARDLALLALLALAGCEGVVIWHGNGDRAPQWSTVVGTGRVTTQSRDVSGFGEVALNIGVLTVRQTGTESLTVEADDNLLPVLTTTVRDNRLSIGYRPYTIIQTTQPILFQLTVKSLTALDVWGNADVHADGISDDSLQVTLGGAAGITAAGTVRQQEVDLSGTGNYDARDLASDIAFVAVGGAGIATVQVRTQLVARVSGAGSVIYYGNPTVTRDVSGAGSVRQG